MGACRRDTFASGSSESRSTSGKMPPSASQRPIFASFSINRNFLPAEPPRSITRVACGRRLPPAGGAEVSCSETTADCGPDELAKASDGSLRAREPEPLGCEPLPCGSPLETSPSFPVSHSAAPHSSQYRDPPRFFVPHLSQIVIGTLAQSSQNDHAGQHYLNAKFLSAPPASTGSVCK